MRPRSSFQYRAFIILCLPLVLGQIFTGILFLDRYWHAITRTMAQHIARTMVLYLRLPSPYHALLPLKATGHAAVPERPPHRLSLHILKQQMRSHNLTLVQGKYFNHSVILIVKYRHQYWRFVMSSHLLFRRSLILFFLWNGLFTLILGGIAWRYMRRQIRPLKELALWVKGKSSAPFRVYGAQEIRSVALACQTLRRDFEDRLAERTYMLQGIAHDLRTPLARLNMQLALLPPSAEHASMKQDIQHMTRMIQSYLSYGNVTPTQDITSLIECVNQWKPPYPRKEVQRHILSPLNVKIRMSQVHLQRCLYNIFDNGWNYAASTVHIRGHFDNAGHFFFVVEDDGPGIPPHAYQRVKQPFVRLEDNRPVHIPGSTGLGLSIVERIITHYQGHIDIEASDHLKGACVTLCFPPHLLV